MFGMAWWLGLGRAPDPAEVTSQLRKKIVEARKFVLLMVGVSVASAWMQSAQAPQGVTIPWDQMSFILCWVVIVGMALLMPSTACHERWTDARRRFVVRVIWLSAVLLVIAAAWDIGLYNDRRWGYEWAWIGLYLGFLVGFFLLAVLGWFTLAGRYLARLTRCACPPPMKRWMASAPRPRSVAGFGEHVCPAPVAIETDDEAVPEAA